MALVTVESNSTDYRLQALVGNLATVPTTTSSFLNYLNTLVSLLDSKTAEMASEIQFKYLSDSTVGSNVRRIETVSYTIDLTGFTASTGSNESKIFAFNHVTGDTYTLTGSLGFAGLPFISPIATGSHLTSFSFATVSPSPNYKSLVGAFNLDATYTLNGFVGPLKSYGESLFDFSGVQSLTYYTFNTTVANNGTGLKVQDGTLTGVVVAVSDRSGVNITDSISIENIQPRLSQIFGSTAYETLLSGNDTVVLKGLGSLPAKGGAGNDVFTNGPGSTAIDGGLGLDTFVESGNRSNYTITRVINSGVTSFVVTDKTGAGGTDTLTSVERIKFADSTVAIDIDGTGGQIYRLYQAAFNRTPDSGGLGYQMSAIDNSGLSLTQVAQNFIASPEFSRTYGNLSNTNFVIQLYANVLHRAPDAGGLKFHVDLLDSNAISRATDLVGFSESPENQAALIGVIGNGFTFTPLI